MSANDHVTIRDHSTPKSGQIEVVILIERFHDASKLTGIQRLEQLQGFNVLLCTLRHLAISGDEKSGKEDDGLIDRRIAMNELGRNTKGIFAPVGY